MAQITKAESRWKENLKIFFQIIRKSGLISSKKKKISSHKEDGGFTVNDYLRRKSPSTGQHLSDRRRRNTSQFILCGQCHPETKTRRHKKRKLQLSRTKGPHGHRNKNLTKLLACRIQQYLKRRKHHGQFIPKHTGLLSIWKDSSTCENQLM